MAEYEARFYTEAKAAGGLNHPNIIIIYDIGKSGHLVYMAMEYIEGRELREMLTEGTAAAGRAGASTSRRRSAKDWRTPTSTRSCTGTSSPPTS